MCLYVLKVILDENQSRYDLWTDNSRRPKYHFTTAQQLISFKICFIAMHLNCFFYELLLTDILKIAYIIQTASLGLAYAKLS